jgi:threonine/homoserine/homoserine lactone efflux protein
MDQAQPDQAITKRTVAGDDICYFSPCSGVAFTMKAAERSQFAQGQLVALGIATFILTLITLVLSLCSIE